MSDTYTIVESGKATYAVRGRVDPGVAIDETQRHYQCQLTEAIEALALITLGSVRVWRVRGIHTQQDRRLVYDGNRGETNA